MLLLSIIYILLSNSINLEREASLIYSQICIYLFISTMYLSHGQLFMFCLDQIRVIGEQLFQVIFIPNIFYLLIFLLLVCLIFSLITFYYLGYYKRETYTFNFFLWKFYGFLKKENIFSSLQSSKFYVITSLIYLDKRHKDNYNKFYILLHPYVTALLYKSILLFFLMLPAIGIVLITKQFFFFFFIKILCIIWKTLCEYATDSTNNGTNIQPVSLKKKLIKNILIGIVLYILSFYIETTTLVFILILPLSYILEVLIIHSLEILNLSIVFKLLFGFFSECVKVVNKLFYILFGRFSFSYSVTPGRSDGQYSRSSSEDQAIEGSSSQAQSSQAQSYRGRTYRVRSSQIITSQGSYTEGQPPGASGFQKWIELFRSQSVQGSREAQDELFSLYNWDRSPSPSPDPIHKLLQGINLNDVDVIPGGRHGTFQVIFLKSRIIPSSYSVVFDLAELKSDPIRNISFLLETYKLNNETNSLTDSLYFRHIPFADDSARSEVHSLLVSYMRSNERYDKLPDQGMPICWRMINDMKQDNSEENGN